MENVIRPTEDIDYRSLQNHQSQNLMIYNNLSARDPYDGQVDKNGEIRLRLAMIDNYEIKRDQNVKYDPLDVTKVVNLNNGLVTLRWLDAPGGIMRPNNLEGEWIHNKENATFNPEDRTLNEWYISSQREMVQLTHSFIWSGKDKNGNNNYCGINYIPPIGAIVIVGFRKLGLPIILGYLSNNYTTLYPILKPGEISTKGYGNNYIHNRQSDKLDLTAWSKIGEKDIDDPNETKTNNGNYKMWIRINANDGNIQLIARDYNNPDFTGNPTIENKITISPIEITSSYNYGVSTIKQNSDSITTSYGNTNIIQNADSITFNSKTININSNNINITNTEAVKINSGSMNSIISNNYDIEAASLFINISEELNIHSNNLITNENETIINSDITNINSNTTNIHSTNTNIHSNNLIMDGSNTKIDHLQTNTENCLLTNNNTKIKIN